MTIKPSLLEDQFVDMAFITSLTGLTDKWFYKLIKDGVFPKPIKLGRVPAGCKAKWRFGCRNVSPSPANNTPIFFDIYLQTVSLIMRLARLFLTVCDTGIKDH